MIKLQALFAITFIAVVVLITTSVGSSPASRDARDEEQTCHLRELDLCLASISVLTQNNNPHPINNAEVNRQCKVLLETEGCLANYTRRCMTNTQTQMVNMLADGGLDLIKDLCKPQSKTRSMYLKHGDCINNQHKAQKNCMRDFQAALEKAVDIDWQDRLKLACCSFNKLHACTRDIVEPACGPEAYELHRLFYKATFSRMPSITCAKYEYNSKICANLLPPAGTIPKGSRSHSVLSKVLSAYIGN